MEKVTYKDYTVNPGGENWKWGNKGRICNKYEHVTYLMGFLHRRTPAQSGKLALVVEAGG